MTAWGKNSRRFNGWINFVLPVAAFIVLFSAFLFVGLLPRLDAIQSGTLPKREVVRLVIGLLATPIVAYLFTFLIDQSTEEQNATRKRSKRGIRKSRRTAKKLGVSVVPVLTKEHVEARIRVDAALLEKRRDQGRETNINPASDDIAVLLFKDLNREQVIISLISDRDITSASEIEEALLEVEAYTAAPVRSGWL